MHGDDRPTFLLGVGCQKGGTAWLHRYLADSPECDPGFRKEYHVWDALDLDEMAHFRTRLGRRVRRAGGQVEQGRPADADTLRLATFLSDPQTYCNYFELLLSRPGIRLTADITPSYAGLSIDRLTMIRDAFDRRGIRVAPVFLMRDPVERIWSAVRMYQQRNPGAHPGSSVERVGHVFGRPRFEGPTRYERTMAAVEQVFGPTGACYALFEELFEAETVTRICRFLGIGAHDPDFDRQVNTSPKERGHRMPEPLARRVAEHYRSTYDAVADRFGRDAVLRRWPTARLLDW
ncbi:MAG: sulfotransferase [Nocardioides sp.]|nr:sulfotransferase [Nocardioidaceae bacterium]MCB8955328.1 sulfotransferase [Nocardioides sp.]